MRDLAVFLCLVAAFLFSPLGASCDTALEPPSASMDARRQCNPEELACYTAMKGIWERVNGTLIPDRYYEELHLLSCDLTFHRPEPSDFQVPCTDCEAAMDTFFTECDRCLNVNVLTEQPASTWFDVLRAKIYRAISACVARCKSSDAIEKLYRGMINRPNFSEGGRGLFDVSFHVQAKIDHDYLTGRVGSAKCFGEDEVRKVMHEIVQTRDLALLREYVGSQGMCKGGDNLHSECTPRDFDRFLAEGIDTIFANRNMQVNILEQKDGSRLSEVALVKNEAGEIAGCMLLLFFRQGQCYHVSIDVVPTAGDCRALAEGSLAGSFEQVDSPPR